MESLSSQGGLLILHKEQVRSKCIDAETGVPGDSSASLQGWEAG